MQKINIGTDQLPLSIDLQGVTEHRLTLDILLVFLLASCVCARVQRRGSTQDASAQKVCVDVRPAGGCGGAKEAQVYICAGLVLYRAAVGMEVRPAPLAETACGLLEAAEALEEPGCGAVDAR